MTVFANVERQCNICGQHSMHHENMSNYPMPVPMGALDLDLRPPETGSTLLALKVQQCPHCGYASHCIEGNVEDNIADIVCSEKYQELYNRSENDLINAFICQSYLSEQLGDYAGAGWQVLRAAWAAEDVGDMDAATCCRCKAVELLLTAKEKQQPFGDEDGESLLLADISRRIGQLTLAEHFCKQILGQTRQEIVKKIASYQLTLIQAQDLRAHSIGEALNGKPAERSCCEYAKWRGASATHAGSVRTPPIATVEHEYYGETLH